MLLDEFRVKKLKCPYCKKNSLILEDTATKHGGPTHKAAYDAIYSALMIPTRRTRLLCNNPDCEFYYKKQHTRFIQGLIPGSLHEEHFWNDAIHLSHRKRERIAEKIKNLFSKAAIADDDDKEAASQSSQEGAEQGDSGAYKGGNPLAGKGPTFGEGMAAPSNGGGNGAGAGAGNDEQQNEDDEQNSGGQEEGRYSGGASLSSPNASDDEAQDDDDDQQSSEQAATRRSNRVRRAS